MSSLISILILMSLAAFVPLYTLGRRLIRQRSLWAVPGPAVASIILGNLSIWLSPTSLPYQEEIVRKYGRVIRIPGFLGSQALSISDPKALHCVLIKNLDNFEVPEGLKETRRLLLGGNGLLSTVGVVHRKQRKLMNPAFSINHMRRMIPVFQSLTLQLLSLMRADIGEGEKELDVLEYLSRVALELISQAGFGHSFRALKGEDQDYSLALKTLVTANGSVMKFRNLVHLLTHNIPGRVLRILGEALPWPDLHVNMRNCDILWATSQRIWDEKKRLYALGDKSVVNEHGEGKDILSILLQANLAASDADRLTEEELVAQITTFTLAGSDTTSNALARILYLLAAHPEMQDRLREEVKDAAGPDGMLGYDDLVGLPLLDAICRETLRLFPPVTVINRECSEDFVLPLAYPYTDTNGKQQDQLFVPAGTDVYVNIAAVNRDPDLWGPDALEWRPERWLAPLPDSVTEARIPGVFANTLTFSGGSRACM